MSWAPVSSGGPPVESRAAVDPTAAPRRSNDAAYTDRRPGSIPMRPLAMGEILDGAMSLLRLAPGATLGLGAIVMAIQLVLTLVPQWLSQRFTFSMFDVTGDMDPALALLGFGLTALLTGLIATTCGGILSGLMATVVGDSSLGRPVTLRSVWRQTRPRIWGLIGLSLVIAFIQLFGSGLLGIGWLFAVGVFAVAGPALVLERIGVFQAISRSWHLTIKDFFRVLGIRCLGMLISSVLAFILALPFLVAGVVVLVSDPTDPSDLRLLVSVFVSGLGAMFGGVISAPFAGCVDAMLYVDRRMRSEGLDIELRYRVEPTAGAGAAVPTAATAPGSA